MQGLLLVEHITKISNSFCEDWKKIISFMKTNTIIHED